MLGAIKYQFSHLFDLTGRDARQTFWFWILFVVIVNIVVSLAVSVPMMANAVSVGIASAQGTGQGPDEAAIMQSMSGAVGNIVLVSLVLGLVNIVLVAAAFVRRLHDSNKSAVWAVVAGAFYLLSHLLSYSHRGDVAELMQRAAAAADPQAALASNSAMAWDGLIGWIPVIMMVVFGVMNSDPGPNKYGDEPVRF